MQRKFLQFVLAVVAYMSPCTNVFSQQSLWVGQTYTCESTHAGTPVLLTNVQWSESPSGLLSVTGSGLYRTVTPAAYFSGSVTVKMTCRYKYTYSSTYRSGTERWTITCVSNPLNISDYYLTIEKGKCDYIGSWLTYTNAYSSSVKYTYSGYNSKIVSVSSDGKVTGLSPGTTSVTVSSTHSANTCTCQVTVTKPSVQSVSLPSSAGCEFNGSKQLSATVLPSDANVSYENWTSSNTSVATVSSTGLVTAVSPGTCNIYCTVNGSVKSNACAFTVCQPSPTAANTGVYTWNKVMNMSGEVETYSIASNGKWYGTICLPYDCDVENGYIYNIYRVDKNDEGQISKIQFETRGADYQAAETHAVEAGVPYLFRRIDQEQPIVFKKTGSSAADIKAKSLANGFTGTYSSVTLPSGSYCLSTVGGVQQFYQTGNKVVCAPFHAYIENLDDLPTEASEVCGIVHTFGDDMTTSISNIPATTSQNRYGKFLRNGHVVIIRNGKSYNSCGQMLNK